MAVGANGLPTLGALVEAGGDLNDAITLILRRAFESGAADAVVAPVKTRGEKSFIWLLIRSPILLERVCPLPPVITTQGARALSGFSEKTLSGGRVVAIMRPCEARAAVELCKLEKLQLERFTVVTVDCPGAIKLSEFFANPERGWEEFSRLLSGAESELLREACRICVFFADAPSDVHIAFWGVGEGRFALVPKSPRGEEFVRLLGLSASADISSWRAAVDAIAGERRTARNEAIKAAREKFTSPDGITAFAAECINCHNCMRVCPICYCERCFFETGFLEFPARGYQQRAKLKGAQRLPADVPHFHLGRMTHMALSCVSCGCCDDACPQKLPVSTLFAIAAEALQEMFDYVPGRSRDEEIPLRTFLVEDELPGVSEATKSLFERGET